jgi:hypothetical protein
MLGHRPTPGRTHCGAVGCQELLTGLLHVLRQALRHELPHLPQPHLHHAIGGISNPGSGALPGFANLAAASADVFKRNAAPGPSSNSRHTITPGIPSWRPTPGPPSVWRHRAQHCQLNAQPERCRPNTRPLSTAFRASVPTPNVQTGGGAAHLEHGQVSLVEVAHASFLHQHHERPKGILLPGQVRQQDTCTPSTPQELSRGGSSLLGPAWHVRGSKIAEMRTLLLVIK